MIARWKRTPVAAVMVAVAMTIAGCIQQPVEVSQAKPQQAGKPVDPLVTAARIAAMQAAATTGNQDAVQRNVAAFNEDFRKSIKLADPARRVDRESARNAAKRVDGVRSVAWLDHENLFAIVSRNDLRSYRTIDEICLQLEPLGDTLGVVVNLQSGVAVTGDELEILSRNCQLAPGERGFMQRTRQVDVIAPEMRAEHQHNRAAADRAVRDREAEAVESLRILEGSTAEM